MNANESIHYLLRLLLFKWLCDVFEEEAETIEKKTDNHELAWNTPNSHQFFIPENARWEKLINCSDIGNELNLAFRDVEAYNPRLEGIFTSFDFENKHNFLGYRDGNEALRELIIEFSRLNLHNNNLAEPGLLGRISDSLIKIFVAETWKDGGAFCTPQSVTELLVRLLDIQEGMSVCDPTCGTGGFLIACANYVRNKTEESNDVLLYGQERGLNIWVIAKINLLLHGIFDFDIRLGDTIRDPKLAQKDKLMLFDRVIADPPFNPKNWGYENADFDYYSRFRYGIPPKNSADFAFIQHILATLKETGKAGVIVPFGVLFRSGKEGLIRQRIVKDDLIEAVIGLPANLLYFTGIPIAILIFNRKKVEERKNKILFIDASNQYQKKHKQNYLRSKDIKHIIACYQNFTNEEEYAKVVAIEELAANDYMLNINRYVLPSNLENKIIDIETELTKLNELEAKRALAENDMNKYLRQLGVNV
ncbi:class I SAM-dependent DNA methyltransferase [Rivularia sp. UHCC 0363]|uniref:class I SAM-dependent DNA methyltransferase n=1 Tax=Rivularia sp. UHCC 0363 TaxID=3110244 RepID=UPI002B201D78|nr:class I SAM-dependent DNA methyltransferase [Rivularia sp. UHCC 0363]MEA5599263.1 class I SAM-dependent DNA methyltransferase [Rivularia sp. UHCC 0363]